MGSPEVDFDAVSEGIDCPNIVIRDAFDAFNR